ncbi:3-hydroxyacyl-CoA dehydrogenase [Meinhardsimonia xiamenensis]|jgi:3-hydroxyacyl-CoA dehydrogenase|uniref:3-hydroxyacyl-CoA dehydrogenase n=1 Tax=Meinhardsimonia xiamenensis TaxID=990712 RepID=A0A1G9B8S7_9RHOB|nr:3-hydroxyacyl-CoA dehydrogenase NAD-binding domain-containing protein [Meinhardsimonia xiamenensis]PRX35074.1 3-hydroxyacyl-CoA dehydrogenase [Meinhardsimonia xiamenensis]SDK35917.1 3-hydroxyacyl-CoA dehydrogenase [Meinhardsimonia xiamenensis]
MQETTGSEAAVRISREGEVGLVEIDNPPVNAASRAVREGLVRAIDALEADAQVKAIALYGAGRSFIAGADIREFGKPPAEPWLPEVCNRIEGCGKPVVAVLHGVALGGGLEVALAAHARIALPGTTVGFPEVTLGVIPGAGGTQRAPRLIGIPAAIDLVTSGKRIDAKRALELGLIDRIEDGAPREIAMRAAREALAGALPTRRTGELPITPDNEALAEAAERFRHARPHLFARERAVEALAATGLPFAEGLKRERALFFECIDSPQRAALIHAFFAERAVARIPEAGAPPRPVESVGVIGAGTMGSGIATAALLAGLPVILTERDAEGLERGRATIAQNLEGAVKRGKLTAERRDAILKEALTPTLDFGALGAADLVIEAAFEDMGVKRDIFARLGEVAKPGAVLATNTSYLDINEMAAASGRPEDVLGLHFFSPAHIMRLVEVVVAEKTAPDAVTTGFALAKRLKKVAVRSGVCDGFIGNRIMTHYRKAADYMLLDGASPSQIDAAIEEFGFAMGPFAVSDLAGLDIAWASRKRRAATRPAEERYVRVADRLCEAGMFGRKTGRGWYLHGEGVEGRVENPEMLKILEEERRAAGITPRHFTHDEIRRRYLLAMIAEAARVLEEGIALRPIDIDAVFLFGYGFPRHHGGPMHYADTIGAEGLITGMEELAREDAYFWQVPELLRRMAADGKRFSDMNDR